MIPVEIRQYLTTWLQHEKSPSTGILSSTPLGGGSINETFRIETTSGTVFIKYNLAKRYPGMFTAEAKGLRILEEADCIQVPKVLHSDEIGEYSFLLLGYIESQVPASDFWQRFGQKLALLHHHSSTSFGLDHDNYIGSIMQINRNHKSWTEFLISERLEPMLSMAMDIGKLNGHDVRKFEILYKKLPEILPVEPPSLIHGDLWSGNFMDGDDGNAWMIDPAVYYGHREMDIAMSKLFGGFTKAFYDAYNDSWPLEPGWQGRIPLNQLYPLLVHVNLFGESYSQQVRQILKDFQ